MREYGSEQPAIVLPDGYFESLKELDREITYLRSGREALLYASCNCNPTHEATILFPAYCCWSMSAPFEKSGWEVIYYRLHEDLTIDEDYLEQLLKNYKPEAILTMNFYGSASTASAIAKVKAFDENITVIEDFSHCTFCLKKIFIEQVDFYVSSIRKSVGVCDGAIVLSKKHCNSLCIQAEQADFADKRFVAQTEKGRYSFSKDQDAKSEFLGTIRECEGIINEFNAVRPISERAKQMLILINGEEIAYSRRQNMKHLWSLLNGKVKMVPGLERSFEGAPFSLPILVDVQDAVQRKLAQNGIYAPLLWPICEEARKVCEVSAYISDHMLSIPIDQRYTWDDMEEMAEKIIECVK